MAKSGSYCRQQSPKSTEYIQPHCHIVRRFFQATGDSIQGFIPANPFEFAFTACTHAFHWVIQAIGMINTPADGATAQTGAYLMVAVLIAAGIVSFHQVTSLSLTCRRSAQLLPQLTEQAPQITFSLACCTVAAALRRVNSKEKPPAASAREPIAVDLTSVLRLMPTIRSFWT